MERLYMTLAELARQLGTRSDRIAEFARREKDPLPARYLPGRRSNAFVYVPELEAWVERNAPLYADVRKEIHDARQI